MRDCLCVSEMRSVYAGSKRVPAILQFVPVRTLLPQLGAEDLLKGGRLVGGRYLSPRRSRDPFMMLSFRDRDKGNAWKI